MAVSISASTNKIKDFMLLKSSKLKKNKYLS